MISRRNLCLFLLYWLWVLEISDVIKVQTSYKTILSFYQIVWSAKITKCKNLRDSNTSMKKQCFYKKKSRFVNKQRESGLISKLGITTPLRNLLILSNILF